jgi:hypothetical protein
MKASCGQPGKLGPIPQTHLVSRRRDLLIGGGQALENEEAADLAGDDVEAEERVAQVVEDVHEEHEVVALGVLWARA